MRYHSVQDRMMEKEGGRRCRHADVHCSGKSFQTWDELEYVIALMGGCSVPFCDILEFAARILQNSRNQKPCAIG